MLLYYKAQLYCICILIISNFIYSLIFYKEKKKNENDISLQDNKLTNTELNILVGHDKNDNLIYINEKEINNRYYWFWKNK